MIQNISMHSYPFQTGHLLTGEEVLSIITFKCHAELLFPLVDPWYHDGAPSLKLPDSFVLHINSPQNRHVGPRCPTKGSASPLESPGSATGPWCIKVLNYLEFYTFGPSDIRVLARRVSNCFSLWWQVAILWGHWYLCFRVWAKFENLHLNFLGIFTASIPGVYDFFTSVRGRGRILFKLVHQPAGTDEYVVIMTF